MTNLHDAVDYLDKLIERISTDMEEVGEYVSANQLCEEEATHAVVLLLDEMEATVDKLLDIRDRWLA